MTTASPDPVHLKAAVLLRPHLDDNGELSERGIPKCVCGERAASLKGQRVRKSGAWVRLWVYCGSEDCYEQRDKLVRVERMRTPLGRVWANVVRPVVIVKVEE